MDYRKDTRTPRDRVDDELLSRLLMETDELLADCGCESGNNSHRSGRSARCDDSNSSRSCGCERNRAARRAEERSGSSCGCEHNRTDLRSDDRGGESCGCGWNRSDRNDDRNDNSCGCIDRRSMSIQTQGLPLVMSYCPDHEFHELNEDEEALAIGTLFRELNFPFYGSNCSGKCGKSCGCGDEK